MLAAVDRANLGFTWRDITEDAVIALHCSTAVPGGLYSALLATRNGSIKHHVWAAQRCGQVVAADAVDRPPSVGTRLAQGKGLGSLGLVYC